MKYFLIFIGALFSFSLSAAADFKIVTTTTDLEAIVKYIGKAQMQTSALAKGTQDPHQIEAKPSFMLKLRDANLVIAHGLELESAWLKSLIQGSRNPKIAFGTSGYYELGGHLKPIEVPTHTISRAEGDVHPGGNPHFTLDPIRIGDAALLIAGRMGQLDPQNADFYKKNANDLRQHLKSKTLEWAARIEKLRIKNVVTYHKTLNYFLKRFKIENSIQLEPKPGIPPTAKHLLNVIALMKQNQIRIVLIENLFDSKSGDKVAKEIPAAKVLSVPVYVGGAPHIETNEQLIENLVRTLEGTTP